MPTIRLPTRERVFEQYTTGDPGEPFPSSLATSAGFNRVALSAAHVVADPWTDVDPSLHSAVDWDATIAFRHHLWDLGLGVAEAMDTAQRGMGLGWSTAIELIRRSVAESKSRRGAVLFSGAGTDQLDPAQAKSLDDVIRAYEEQIDAIEAVGGRIILMASRTLARVAKGPDDYVHVYGRILSQVREPVILHWLGEMFDPTLAGYWGAANIDRCMNTVLEVINSNSTKVDGIKVSVLDKDREIAMRRRLVEGVRMYTGDDFNYPELIAGDDQGYSHALLGIFDAIAPAASAALSMLGAGDERTFHQILAPTVPLSRHIFRTPTRFCKTGVVFIAYLNGHQDHFVMIGGQESARSTLHLAELFRLADRARLLRDPELAASRMSKFLAVRGFE